MSYSLSIVHCYLFAQSEMSDSAQSSDSNKALDRLSRDTGGRPIPMGGVWVVARARREQRMLDASRG